MLGMYCGDVFGSCVGDMVGLYCGDVFWNCAEV